MATSREFCEYVVDCLAHVGDISVRPMMGEYCVYLDGQLVGLLCDNMMLVKPTPTVQRLLPDAERMLPYEGSRTLMTVVDGLENRPLTLELFRGLAAELPPPKPKRKNGGRGKSGG